MWSTQWSASHFQNGLKRGLIVGIWKLSRSKDWPSTWIRRSQESSQNQPLSAWWKALRSTWWNRRPRDEGESKKSSMKNISCSRSRWRSKANYKRSTSSSNRTKNCSNNSKLPKECVNKWKIMLILVRSKLRTMVQSRSIMRPMSTHKLALRQEKEEKPQLDVASRRKSSSNLLWWTGKVPKTMGQRSWRSEGKATRCWISEFSPITTPALKGEIPTYCLIQLLLICLTTIYILSSYNSLCLFLIRTAHKVFLRRQLFSILRTAAAFSQRGKPC